LGSERDVSLKLERRKDSSETIVTNVPLEVTKVKYPGDQRLKQLIEPIDEDALFHRLNQVRLESYVGLSSESRTRGVNGEALFEIFPEHVSVVPEYQLADGTVLKDFIKLIRMLC